MQVHDLEQTWLVTIDAPRSVPDHLVYNVHSQRFDKLNMVAAALASVLRSQVHTEWNQIYDGAEFASKISSSPNWDYRNEGPTI